MKILITGGCGFIGTNLVRYLIEQTEHAVANVDKLSYAANPNSLADIAASPRYQFFQADLANKDAIEQIMQRVDPDAIMHLAAETHVDRSIDGPENFLSSNIVGTFRLLESTRRWLQSVSNERREHFRLIHVSTDEVYGSLEETGAFDETSRYDPRSPYAASKAASDHLARAWQATFDVPVIVTQCSNNYGPYQFPEKLIPHIIIRAMRREPLPVYGRGENVRDWLAVADHVDALLAVLDKGVVGETYNIGGNNERRNIDLVRSICEILDARRPLGQHGSYADLITFVADRPGHDFRYAIDNRKICDQLGWRPKRTFEDGLPATIAWYLDNEPWWQAILDGSYRLQRLGEATGDSD